MSYLEDARGIKVKAIAQVFATIVKLSPGTRILEYIYNIKWSTRLW